MASTISPLNHHCSRCLRTFSNSAKPPLSSGAVPRHARQRRHSVLHHARRLDHRLRFRCRLCPHHRLRLRQRRQPHQSRSLDRIEGLLAIRQRECVFATRSLSRDGDEAAVNNFFKPLPTPTCGTPNCSRSARAMLATPPPRSTAPMTTPSTRFPASVIVRYAGERSRSSIARPPMG